MDGKHAPTIASVTVVGNPSRKIRQGFSGIPIGNRIVVSLTGEHLDETTAVTVGDGPNALDGAITLKAQTSLAFTVLIPHGAPTGALVVKVMAPSGSATFVDAITITPITVAPTGSDALDIGLDSTGTDEHPLRTLTKALALASTGDTVLLKNGTYSIADGESFPENPNIPNVPDDITINGQGPGGTLIQAPGRGDCTAGSALVLAGSARIEKLSIAGFCRTPIIATAEGSSVTIRNVTIRDSDGAMLVKGNTTLDSVEISGAKIAIDALKSHGPVTVSNSRVHHNGSGIDAQFATGALVVTASEIDHNCPGTSVSRDEGGILVTGPATLTDVNVHDNMCPGVAVPADGLSGQLTITRVFFANNTSAVALDGTGNTKIRESTFSNNAKAISLGGEARLDLGTPEGRGINGFSLCTTCDGIFDARPAPTRGSNPITVTGTSWSQGTVLRPPLGCSDTDEPKGRTSPPRLWHIEHPGSCASATGNIILN